ncbi:glycosyltransferase [archaeon]|nr:glycosyltransferase [archaeon]
MISVIIPAYNEENNIKACLESIRSKFYDDYEIIIIIGGDDRTYDIAKEYGNAVRDNESQGAGPARNKGSKLAKGDVLVFIDADTVVNPHWLEKFAKVFEDPKVVASGGPVRPLEGTLIDKVLFKLNQDWGYRFTSFFHIYQFSGQSCAFRKSVFDKIGGFNEEMSFLEDTEISNRIKKEGKCVYIPDNWVASSPRRFHKKGYLQTLWKFLRNYFYMIVLHRLPKEAYFASVEKKKD